MRYNCRGQESKFLTGFPTLLLVIICIGIFLAFSFALAPTKGMRGVAVTQDGESGSFLYRPIMVGTQNLLVLDAVLRADSEDFSHQLVAQGLFALFNSESEDSCLLIALGESPQPSEERGGGAARNDFYIFKENGVAREANFGAYPHLFASYRGTEGLKSTSVLLHVGTLRYIEYYFGRCRA